MAEVVPSTTRKGRPPASSPSPTSSVAPDTPCTRPTCLMAAPSTPWRRAWATRRRSGSARSWSAASVLLDGLPTELVLRRLLARCGPGPTSGADAPRCARGAPLLFLPPVSEFGSAWPVGVPVQVHGMDADPIFAGEGDIDAGRALVEETDDAELFLYPGDQHLFV